VWDGDGAESAVSTVDSLGEDDLDDCGYANMSVRAAHKVEADCRRWYGSRSVACHEERFLAYSIPHHPTRWPSADVLRLVSQDAVASLYGAFPLEGFSQAEARQLGLDDGPLPDDFLRAATQQPGPASAAAAADSPFVFGRTDGASSTAAAFQSRQLGAVRFIARS
jgi:hypothetical protein